jgi:hypothetical protein
MEGDSVVIVDLTVPLKFNIFSLDGTYARTVLSPIGPSRFGTQYLGTFADNSVLLRKTDDNSTLEGDISREYGTLFRFSLSDTVASVVARAPGLANRADGKVQAWSAQGHQALADSTVFVGRGDQFEIREHNLTGRLQRIVRLIRKPRAPTAVEIETWKELALASPAAKTPAVRRRFEETVFPEALPFHWFMLADAVGNLWVQELRIRPTTNDPSSGNVWEVFDSGGVHLGPVVVPEGLRIFEIGADYILSRWRDADGVEHVREYILRKPNAGL